MSDETKRQDEHETQPTGEAAPDVGATVDAPTRPPAIRFWEITLSPELDAALHVKAI